MTDMILILADDPNGEALLAHRSRDGVDVTRGDVAMLSPLLRAPYAIILPGQHVRAFLTDVPEKIRGAERANVARFAHEDRLAVDLDDLHIVVGSGDPAPTLMVAQSFMMALLEHFYPHHIYTDFDALAGLGADPIRLLGRVVTPGPQGDAVDPDWAETARTIYDDETLARSIFERMDNGAALDLRSGAYRRRTKIQAGAWARVAAVAIVCGLLGLGLTLADARATSAQAADIQDRARAVYTQVTGQPAPDNLARAARSAATTDTDPAAFLALSNTLFTAMASHPDITVERLSFETRENTLRLRLIYPGFESAGALEQTVAASGATFVTGGVREQSGRFIGDASLSLGDGS
jgi:type II secretory pathway component PulL